MPTMRSPTHLERLEQAIATIPNEDAKAIARKLDAVLEPYSIFWGEEDGDRFVEWGGAKHGESGPNWHLRLYVF